ncbi:MAG: YheC/YheD family protein [Heliobacteriaceae bacterium]|nr:YheC/YheD family protein [Heliobacteriaceae bacterium]
MRVPDVGVLAWGTGSQAKPFGRWSYPLGKTVSALERRGLKVAVIPAQALNGGKTVVGWYPLKTAASFRWAAQKTMLPDIFYNRILGRQREKRKSVQAGLQALAGNGKIVFNPGYLSKAAIYEHLTDTEVNAYLPDTLVTPTPQAVIEFLQRWPVVYLKPLESCQGRGIFRLAVTGRSWLVKGVRKKETLTRLLSHKQALVTWLGRVLHHRQYLAQRGIRLDRLQSRQYDLRVLCQKGADGEWAYVGAGIRLAARGQIVTHRPNGGQVVSVKQVMVRRFGAGGWREKEGELAEIAVMASRLLERGHGGNFGLLSLDVACDAPEGKFWILEMNSKPGAFDEGRIQRKSDNLLAGYLRYLLVQRGKGNASIHSA